METLKAMGDKEKVNAPKLSKMKKPRLVDLLRKHHAKTLKMRQKCNFNHCFENFLK